MKISILKKTVFLNILSLFFYSCTPTYIQTSTSKRNYVYNIINSFDEDYKARIYLDTNKEYFGENVKINNDTISWFDFNLNKRINVKTKRITKIIMQEKIPYTIIGFLTGALGTYGTLRILGIEPGHGHPDAGIIVYPGMIAGGIIGAIYGTSKNNKTVFLFNYKNEN